MAYSTLTDIYKALPEQTVIELTDDDNLGVVNQDVINEAVAWADDVIDNHLRERYSVPLTTVPDTVRKIHVDLVVYFLYSRRFDIDIPEGIQERYKNALKMLEKIQKGHIVLSIGTLTGASELRTNKTTSDREFGPDTWEKY